MQAFFLSLHGRSLLCFLLPLFFAAAWYLWVYFRAMAPKAGTLEWIKLYDRPPFQLAGAGHSLGVPVPFVLTGVGAGVFGWLCTCLADQQALSALLQVCSQSLVVLPWAIALAFAGYLLLQRLFGQVLISIFGTFLLCSEPFLPLVPTCFTVLALLLFFQWFTFDGAEHLWQRGVLFAGSALCMLAGFYTAPQLLWLLPGFIGLTVVGFTARVRAQEPVRRVCRDAALAAGLCALGAVLLCVAYDAKVFWGTLAGPLMGVVPHGFGAALANGACAMAQLLWRPGAVYDTAFVVDGLLLALGLACFAGCVHVTVYCRDCRGLFAGSFALLSCAVSLCAGLWLLPLGCVLCCGVVYNALILRGRKAYAVGCAAVLLVVQVALYLVCCGTLPL